MNRQKKSNQPRMRDIASQAGVSLGTVSRVLNGKADVAPNLSKRVMEAVHAIGYEPRMSLRSPKSNQLGPFGVLMDNIAYNTRNTTPFQSNLIHGIERRSHKMGGHMVLSCCQDDAENKRLPAMIQDDLVKSAIIRINRSIPDTWVRMLAQRIPTVLLMQRNHDHSIPSVACDDHGSLAQILSYLADLGHHRVGFYSEDEGQQTTPIHLERQLYFERLLPTFGLSVDPNLVKVPRRRANENYKELIERTGRSFLDMGKKRPTAIVCAADTYALPMQVSLTEQGLSLPGDMSIIGFMNTNDCEHASPTLTSISLNEEELGRAAIDLLEERIRNPNAIPRHTLVGTTLVRRESCAPPSLT